MYTLSEPPRFVPLSQDQLFPPIPHGVDSARILVWTVPPVTLLGCQVALGTTWTWLASGVGYIYTKRAAISFFAYLARMPVYHMILSYLVVEQLQGPCRLQGWDIRKAASHLIYRRWKSPLGEGNSNQGQGFAEEEINLF